MCMHTHVYTDVYRHTWIRRVNTLGNMFIHMYPDVYAHMDEEREHMPGTCTPTSVQICAHT